MSKNIAIWLGITFLFLAVVALIQSQPQHRDKRVYHILQPYIPYKIEKNMSGLFIRDTITKEKIEPSNTEVYHVLDNLEKKWGKKHLRLENETLIIVDDANKTLKTVILRNKKEKAYIHDFFGL